MTSVAEPASHASPPASASGSGPVPAVTMADQVLEVAMLLGSGAAVMNQIAMPGVGLGVVEHSTTLQRQADRLRTTLTYVYGMAVGTEEEKRTIARLVNKAHVPIRSEGRYSAFDPELQLWVAATLTEMGERVWELTFGPLDPVSREHIYRETWIYGTALQVKESSWPQTRAEFDDYWQRSLARLRPDPRVQKYAAALIDWRRAPWPYKPLLPLQNLLARGLVSQQTRDALGFAWTRRDQMLFDLFWKVFPPVYRFIPRPLRTLRARLLMRDFRRRLRLGRRVI